MCVGAWASRSTSIVKRSRERQQEGGPVTSPPLFSGPDTARPGQAEGWGDLTPSSVPGVWGLLGGQQPHVPTAPSWEQL